MSGLMDDYETKRADLVQEVTMGNANGVASYQRGLAWILSRIAEHVSRRPR